MVVGLLFPKGRTRKSLKAKRDRSEAQVKKAVRAQCVEMDGYCFVRRYFGDLDCHGGSQWTHLPPRTRSATRGMPPEYRHSVEYSGIACAYHHDRIDGRRQPRLIIPTPLVRGAYLEASA